MSYTRAEHEDTDPEEPSTAMPWHGWFDGIPFMMAGLGLVFTLLVVIAVVVALIAATRSRTPPADDPRRILDQRLARGEIDPDEYEERRRLLDQRG